MSHKKYRLAFVTVRYGLDVVGGAEFLTRMYAEHLAESCDVTVITTKARDHMTWEDYYTADTEQLNGVTVRRFSADQPRDVELTNSLNMFSPECDLEREETWMKAQGPMSKKLLSFIEQNKDNFDYFFFCPYLYPTTYFGTQIVPDKAVLIPALHDEAVAYFSLFKPMFKNVRGYICSTPEELEYIYDIYGKSRLPAAVIGVGLEKIQHGTLDKEALKKKYNLPNPYILYIGRMEEGKNISTLFAWFDEYKKSKPSNLDLVLVGRAVVDIPQRRYMKFLGFVSPEEKYALIDNCLCVVNPSRFESLSLILMEAWLREKPVFVNGECAVLKGQVERANGGLWFTEFSDFAAGLDWFVDNQEVLPQLGASGKQYVDTTYDWSVVEEKFLAFLKRLDTSSDDL